MRGSWLSAAALTLGLVACTGPAGPSAIQVRSLVEPTGFKTVHPDWREIARHPLGSRQNPVRTDLIAGERVYLERLRCADGSRVSYEAGGAFDSGPYGTILNAYELRCPSGQTATIWMDRAHASHVERRAVPGFSLAGP